MRRKLILIFLIAVGVSSIATIFNFPIATADTWVGGHITEDTTWTITDSPFVAISDVIVDANATLTIDPGVEVKFGDGFGIQVDGTLNAIGETTSPIVFTSNRIEPNPPYPGCWKGIEFRGGQNESFTMKYSKVQYATNGIKVTQTSGKVTIENCEVSHSYENGVHVETGLVSGGNLRLLNNTSHNNRYSGFYIYADSDIFNVTMSGNIAYENGENGITLLALGWYNHYIHNVSIVKNVVYSNTKDGIKLQGGYRVEFSNITISENECYSNDIGINVYNRGSYTYNVSLLHNRVWSNRIGINLETYYYRSTDLNYIFDNTVSANYYGIYVYDDINVICERNSISYNSYGIWHSCYRTSVFHYNDIYSNSLYGMYRYRGTLNSTYNFWGHSSGPYHVSINPTGEGDSVNGDGINLVFIPFLSAPVGYINQRPIANLEVSPTQPRFNQTVTFNASASTDDGRVDYYYFDFGDGTSTGWTTLSVVFHEYSQEGVYNATLIVKDDFGVTSLNGNLVYVEITVVPEFTSLIILPLLMIVTLLAVMFCKRNLGL